MNNANESAKHTNKANKVLKHNNDAKLGGEAQKQCK